MNHLDWQHQHQILKTLSTLTEQHSATLVMALHDVNLAARYCSHTLMMFDNAESLLGKTSELLTTENLHRLYQTPITQLDSPHGQVFIPD